MACRSRPFNLPLENVKFTGYLILLSSGSKKSSLSLFKHLYFRLLRQLKIKDTFEIRFHDDKYSMEKKFNVGKKNVEFARNWIENY